jgi:hypothetical protein
VQRVGTGASLGHPVRADEVPRRHPLNAQMWSVEVPLVTFGTPAQQQAYLPALAPVPQGLHDQGCRENVGAGPAQLAGTGRPWTPNSAHFRHASRGNSPDLDCPRSLTHHHLRLAASPGIAPLKAACGAAVAADAASDRQQ